MEVRIGNLQPILLEAQTAGLLVDTWAAHAQDFGTKFAAAIMWWHFEIFKLEVASMTVEPNKLLFVPAINLASLKVGLRLLRRSLKLGCGSRLEHIGTFISLDLLYALCCVRANLFMCGDVEKDLISAIKTMQALRGDFGHLVRPSKTRRHSRKKGAKSSKPSAAEGRLPPPRTPYAVI
tara:strand:- start:466 stop:1002 length:537 start_codon:yes stop_codon:yes gene_type:complete